MDVTFELGAPFLFQANGTARRPKWRKRSTQTRKKKTRRSRKNKTRTKNTKQNKTKTGNDRRSRRLFASTINRRRRRRRRVWAGAKPGSGAAFINYPFRLPKSRTRPHLLKKTMNNTSFKELCLTERWQKKRLLRYLTTKFGARDFNK